MTNAFDRAAETSRRSMSASCQFITAAERKFEKCDCLTTDAEEQKVNCTRPVAARSRDLGTFILRTAAIIFFSFAATQLAASQSSTASSSRIPVIITILTPYGFEPSKATVPGGPFVLYVINQAGGKGDPDLSVEGADKKELLRTKASRSGLDGWQLLNLPSGHKYKLRLSNHQKAVFEIEVLP